MKEEFNEFELLTLRDGLFSIRNNNIKFLTDKEFKQIDNKIKLMLVEIQYEK